MQYRRRNFLGVVSASVVATVAGCTDSDNPESNEDTSTEQELTIDDVELPSGYSQKGITDIEAAKMSQAEALDNRTHTVNIITDTGMYGSGEEIMKYDPPNKEYRGELTRDLGAYDSGRDESQVRNYYFSQGKHYQKTVNNGNEPTYNVEQSSYENSHTQIVLWDTLGAYNFSIDGVRRKNGETLIRYTADTLSDSADQEVEGTTSAMIDVRVDGLIRSHGVQFGDVEVDNSFSKASIEISKIGETSVSEPDWIAEADSGN